MKKFVASIHEAPAVCSVHAAFERREFLTYLGPVGKLGFLTSQQQAVGIQREIINNN